MRTAATRSPFSTRASRDRRSARPRPGFEFGALFRDPVFWGVGVPRGDGRSVLVLPGLGGGDAYLQPLRGWLRRVGYSPIRSGLDRNPGWSQELVDELGAVVEKAAKESGKPVSISGHSMGGLIARSIGKARPASVDRIITLGSPLAMGTETLPPTVALTAIYSRDDRIVRYPSSLARDPGAASIEVPGSHIGLAMNAAVYRELGRLLAAPRVAPVSTAPIEYL